MKIAAVIVTYFPPDNFGLNLASVCEQVDRVFVIDNGSTSFSFDQAYESDKVTVFINEENIGLAAAQNMGVKAALEGGYDWILFLDQDSFLTRGYVSTMLSHFQSLDIIDKKRVFMLGPRIFDEGGGFFYKHLVKWGSLGFKRVSCAGEIIENVIFIISAGSFIARWAFEKLGFFKEEFFIDYVDNEFCLRGISRGFKIQVVCNAILFHKIGARRLVKIGSFTVKPTFHSFMRRYTIYRNRVWVWKLYFRRVFPFVFFDILATFCDLLRIVTVEDNVSRKLRYAIKGLWVGLKTPARLL